MELTNQTRKGSHLMNFKLWWQIIKNEIMQIGRERWAQIQRDTW